VLASDGDVGQEVGSLAGLSNITLSLLLNAFMFKSIGVNKRVILFDCGLS
jgi:hypothetical protein